MEQTLIESAPAYVGAQPALVNRFHIGMKEPPWAPLLHPDSILAPPTRDSFAERHLRGAGSLAAAELYALREYSDDIVKQINFLCEHEFVAGTGRSRILGFKRKAAIRKTMLKFVEILNACGDHSLRLRNINEFGEEHLLALLSWFAREKTKRSTIHNTLSILRKFMTLLGRRHLVPASDELALLVVEHDISMGFGGRSYAAYICLAWSASVDVDRVLQEIQKKDKHAHLLCLLCLLFGLRLSEVLRLRPAESDQGDRLWISRGSKGGRQRWIPLSKDLEQRAKQRAVLEMAKAACGGDVGNHLGFGDRTLEQAQKYFESVLTQCGVGKRRLGISLHGLRHEYAVRRFAELSGLPAPVLRQAPLAAYAARMSLVRGARAQLAAELGHGRPSVVSKYIGSLPLLREEAKQTKLAAQILGQHCAELKKFGVRAVTVAVRKIDDQQHTCTLYVQFASGDVARHADSVARVRKSAGLWLGRKVQALLVAAPAQAGMATICMKRFRRELQRLDMRFENRAAIEDKFLSKQNELAGELRRKQIEEPDYQMHLAVYA
jgi:site-specific recombinase XerD